MFYKAFSNLSQTPSAQISAFYLIHNENQSVIRDDNSLDYFWSPGYNINITMGLTGLIEDIEELKLLTLTFLANKILPTSPLPKTAKFTIKSNGGITLDSKIVNLESEEDFVPITLDITDIGITPASNFLIEVDYPGNLTFLNLLHLQSTFHVINGLYYELSFETFHNPVPYQVALTNNITLTNDMLTGYTFFNISLFPNIKFKSISEHNQIMGWRLEHEISIVD